MAVSRSFALLAVILSAVTLIAAEEQTNDSRTKKAAYPAVPISSISGIVPGAGYPRLPGYYPGHAGLPGAYPHAAGIYGPHAPGIYNPHSTPGLYSPHQYVPDHPLTPGYPFNSGYPYAAHPFSAGYTQPQAAYPYNKYNHAASPFGYPYKAFDDGQYYPEKYEYPYAV